MSEDKFILVTGANGLIGYAVAEELTRLEIPVVGLVRSRPAPYDFNFKTFVADLNDIHSLHRLFETHEIDTILHSGAVSGPMLAHDNPYSICNTNIMGTANILEAARIHSARRIVYTSSTTAYGDTPEGPVDEGTNLRPNDVYGATKAAGEYLVRAYSSQHSLMTVSLRISWVYGPRRRTDCVIRTMIEDALAARITSFSWGEDFYRQYIYIDDVVSGILAVLTADSFPKDVYNMTGGDYSSIKQIAEIICDIFPNATIDLSLGPDPFDVIQKEFDISAIKKDFGFSPQFSLRRGIEKYISWLRLNK